MRKNVRLIFIGISAAAAGFFVAMQDANAYGGNHCREYTRTVFIGGRTQEAYGTACLQPDGSWMIVGEGLGNDIGTNVSDVRYVVHERPRDIVPPRVVYYERAPAYIYNRPPPRPYSVWHNDGRFYRNGVHISIGGNKRDYGWNDRRRYDHHYRHGHHNGRGHHGHHGHRGRGNGHWRD